jgi:hypothetical protein
LASDSHLATPGGLTSGRINEEFLDAFGVLKVIAVQERFGSEVRDVIELRDDPMPVYCEKLWMSTA